MNFLEQLASEYYAIQGYFVRTNVKANRRANGGWNNELDVLAFQPAQKELIHLETSWDAWTWEKRKERYVGRKFILTPGDYCQLLGTPIKRIRKRAVVGTAWKLPPNLNWGQNIEIISVPQFVAEVAQSVKGRHPMNDVIPETYPCMRSIQFALAFGLKS